MPQKLSSLLSPDDERNAKVRVEFLPQKVLEQPILAAQAFAVESHMSFADAEMTTLVGALTSGKAKPIIDYYCDLRNDAPKAAIVFALAKSHLEGLHLSLFDAIWKLYETAQKLRNPVAHWLWGTCDKVPNALMAVDPREVHRITAKKDVIYHAAKRAKAANAPWHEMETLRGVHNSLQRALFSHVFVYRESDFRSIIREIKRVHDHTLTFISLVHANRDDPDKAVQIYQQLIQQPEFRSLVAIPHQQTSVHPPDTQPQDAQTPPVK